VRRGTVPTDTGASWGRSIRRPSAAAPRRVFLTGHQGPISGAAFDTKGRLISVGLDGTARRRAIRRDDLIELGRLKTGRNLTRTRWALDFEDESYHPTFDDLGGPRLPQAASRFRATGG
jgi:hypothetical protein